MFLAKIRRKKTGKGHLKEKNEFLLYTHVQIQRN